MRKLFNSGKVELKNERKFKFLNSMKSWGFFVVACCVTIFMYVYFHGNNELVRADNDPPSYTVTVEYYLDRFKVNSTSILLFDSITYKKGQYEDQLPSNNTISLTGAADLSFKITNPKYFFEKASKIVNDQSVDETPIEALKFGSDVSSLDVGTITESCTIRFYFLSTKNITFETNDSNLVNGVQYSYTFTKFYDNNTSKTSDEKYISFESKSIEGEDASYTANLAVPNLCDLKLQAKLKPGYTACQDDANSGFALQISDESNNQSILEMVKGDVSYTYTFSGITADKQYKLLANGLRKDKITISSPENDKSLTHCDVYIWEGSGDFPTTFEEPSSSNGFVKYDGQKSINHEWSTDSAGQKFKVFIVPKGGYNKNEYNITINDNETKQGADVQVYECEKFNGDYGIVVSGISPNAYNVKFEGGNIDKATVTITSNTENKAIYDQECTFKIELGDGYTKSTPTCGLKNKDTSITPIDKDENNGYYSFTINANNLDELVKDNEIVVTVSDIKLNEYKVTFIGTKENENKDGGYNLSDRAETNLSGGGYITTVTDTGNGTANLAVNITAKKGYRFKVSDKSITVKRNDAIVNLSDGYSLNDYVLSINLSDINDDTVFKIENIMYKQYDVKFLSDRGDYNTNNHISSSVATIYAVDGNGNTLNSKLEEAGTTVTKSTQYYYKIEIQKEYKVSDSGLNVSIGRNNIIQNLSPEKIENNVYKISFLPDEDFLGKFDAQNNDENFNITISGLEAALRKVSFKGKTDGCSFTAVKDNGEKVSISTGANAEYSVEHGKGLKFNINVNNGRQFQNVDDLRNGKVSEWINKGHMTHVGGNDDSTFNYSYTNASNTFTVEIGNITEDIDFNFNDLTTERTYTINFKYNGELLKGVYAMPVYNANMAGYVKYVEGGSREFSDDEERRYVTKNGGKKGDGCVTEAHYNTEHIKYLLKIEDDKFKFNENTNIASIIPSYAGNIENLKMDLGSAIIRDCDDPNIRCTDQSIYFYMKLWLNKVGDTDEIDINLSNVSAKRNVFVEYPASIINKDDKGIEIVETNMDSFEQISVGLNYFTPDPPDLTNPVNPDSKTVKALIDFNNRVDVQINSMGYNFHYEYYECDRNGESKNLQKSGDSDNGILNLGFGNDGKHYYIKITLPPETQEIHFRQIEGIKYYRENEKKEGDTATTTVYSIIPEYTSQEKGKNLKFFVEVGSGYDSSSLELKLSVDSGNTIPLEGTNFEDKPNNRTFIVYNLNGANSKISSYIGEGSFISISGKIDRKKYKVTFDTIKEIDNEVPASFVYNGSEVNGQSFTVEHGSIFKFTIQVKEKYGQSNFNIKSGNDEIKPYNGEYIINGVTNDITISAEGFRVNQYVITFTPNEYIDYLDTNGEALSTSRSVKYGDKLDFKLTPKNGYKLDDTTSVLLTGNSSAISIALKAKNDTYTIDGTVNKSVGITEDVTITVKNVEEVKFKVTLEKVDGVTYLNETGSVIYGTHEIKYGNNFEFGIVLDDAYDDSLPGMFVIVNDGKSSGVSAQKIASGRYIIPNVNQDIKIRVGNIFKNKYTVTFVKIEGIDYYDSKGKKIDGSKEVEQNASLEFNVYLYPAYSDSNITVMLGDKEMNPGPSGNYLIPNIDENKTVTVIGVEKAKEFEIVNDINSLPDSIDSIDDANRVTEISKIYNSLSDEKKKIVLNADVLERLQEQVKNLYHNSNGVTVDGLDWYLKLMVVPISTDTEVCSRIYKKLNSEYILSLYDIYLWDTLNDCRYTLPEGKSVVVTIPTPDMTYFEKPTGIHENNSGKIDYLALTFKDDVTAFEATSFSPMGVIASRSSTPGRSSLLDAVDANVDLIKDFALSSFGNNSSGKESGIQNSVFDDKGFVSESDENNNDDNIEGNISEKYRSRNNRVTATGSALRLILVLMILILIALALWILYKRRKEKKKHAENT